MTNGVTLSPAFAEVTLFQQLAKQQPQPVIFTLTNNTAQELVFRPEVLEAQFPDGKQLNVAATELAKTILVLPTELTLAPQARGTFSAQLSMPDTVSAGTHQFLIAFQQYRNQPGSIQSAVAAQLIVTQQKEAIYKVSPEIVGTQHLSLGKINQLELKIENLGNTYVRPYARISVLDLTGRVVGFGTINTDSQVVKPHQQVLFPAPLTYTQPTLPISVYQVKVDGRIVPNDTTFSLTTSVVMIDPVTTLFWVVLITSLIFFFKKKRRTTA